MNGIWHAVFGGGILGVTLAFAGVTFNEWQYWAISVVVYFWYFTKPKN